MTSPSNRKLPRSCLALPQQWQRLHDIRLVLRFLMAARRHGDGMAKDLGYAAFALLTRYEP